MRRIYAWKPDVPDHRDRYFKPRAVKLAPKVERLCLGNRIENQGALSSCTGNSSTSALEVVLKTDKQLSRLMAYYNARRLENLSATKRDDGAYIRNAIKGLFKFGASTERLWPYNKTRVFTRPSEVAEADGKTLVDSAMTNLEYARVLSLTGLRTAIHQGFPVVFGFTVTAAFEDMKAGTVLQVPETEDEMLGGHAVVAVGYDMTAKDPFVWVRNSWGKAWGEAGYFRMSVSWFTDNRRLVDDMWVIRRKA